MSDSGLASSLCSLVLRHSANGAGCALASCCFHALAAPHSRHVIFGLEMGARPALAVQVRREHVRLKLQSLCVCATVRAAIVMRRPEVALPGMRRSAVSISDYHVTSVLPCTDRLRLVAGAQQWQCADRADHECGADSHRSPRVLLCLKAIYTLARAFS